MADKTADLAGPGISTYEEVEKILPNDYKPVQTPKDRMDALYTIKEHIEKCLEKLAKILEDYVLGSCMRTILYL